MGYKKKSKKTEIWRTGGRFDLAMVIKLKRKMFSKPLTSFIYNRTKDRQVENNDDWLDGLNFGFEQCLRSLENWLGDNK